MSDVIEKKNVDRVNNLVNMVHLKLMRSRLWNVLILESKEIERSVFEQGVQEKQKGTDWMPANVFYSKRVCQALAPSPSKGVSSESCNGLVGKLRYNKGKLSIVCAW